VSEPQDTDTYLDALSNQLQNRHYSPQIISTSMDRAKQIDRTKLLSYQSKEPNTRTPLVLTYHPKLSKTSSLVHRHMPTLHKSHRLQQVFPDPPFRRPRNLKDLLVNAALPTDEADEMPECGCLKCPSYKCIVCNFIAVGSTFTSTVTNEHFPITSNLHCKMT